VDSVDRARLNTCGQELHNLLKEEVWLRDAFIFLILTFGFQRLYGAPVLIFANKQDLPSALSTEQIVEYLQLEKMSTSRRWRIFSCSAITGEGLEDGISWLVETISTHGLA
jgi:ADP-ribosylation factor-like protein 2